MEAGPDQPGAIYEDGGNRREKKGQEREAKKGLD